MKYKARVINTRRTDCGMWATGHVEDGTDSYTADEADATVYDTDIPMDRYELEYGLRDDEFELVEVSDASA